MSVTGVTTKLAAMTDINLLREYMGEMYPTNQLTPADGDDYTYQPLPIRDDGLSLGRIQIFDDTDTPLTYAALVRTVYRLQDEVAALAGQVVELRERMEKWTADS